MAWCVPPYLQKSMIMPNSSKFKKKKAHATIQHILNFAKAKKQVTMFLPSAGSKSLAILMNWEMLDPLSSNQGKPRPHIQSFGKSQPATRLVTSERSSVSQELLQSRPHHWPCKYAIRWRLVLVHSLVTSLDVQDHKNDLDWLKKIRKY